MNNAEAIVIIVRMLIETAAYLLLGYLAFMFISEYWLIIVALLGVAWSYSLFSKHMEQQRMQEEEQREQEYREMISRQKNILGKDCKPIMPKDSPLRK